MIRKLLIGTAVASFAVVGIAGSAASAAGNNQGPCVPNGVQAIGGKSLKGDNLIKAAATGNLLPGVSTNLVSTVIKDHVFDGAALTESVLNVTICN